MLAPLEGHRDAKLAGDHRHIRCQRLIPTDEIHRAIKDVAVNLSRQMVRMHHIGSGRKAVVVFDGDRTAEQVQIAAKIDGPVGCQGQTKELGVMKGRDAARQRMPHHREFEVIVPMLGIDPAGLPGGQVFGGLVHQPPIIAGQPLLDAGPAGARDVDKDATQVVVYHAGSAVDGAIDAAATQQTVVGGVDDGVDLQVNDVADQRPGGMSYCLLQRLDQVGLFP